MKRRIIGLLALLLTSAAGAETVPDEVAARHFLDSFYSALRNHDAAALDRMIATEAKVVVYLNGDDGEQKFTFSKADYLQQIKAVWPFASQEQYSVKNIAYRAGGAGQALLSLDESESRVVLGNNTGQNNQLAVSLMAGADGIHIAAITSHTTLW